MNKGKCEHLKELSYNKKKIIENCNKLIDGLIIKRENIKASPLFFLFNIIEKYPSP